MKSPACRKSPINFRGLWCALQVHFPVPGLQGDTLIRVPCLLWRVCVFPVPYAHKVSLCLQCLALVIVVSIQGCKAEGSGCKNGGEIFRNRCGLVLLAFPTACRIPHLSPPGLYGPCGAVG